ncbi:glycosyltransferase [Rhodococcus erythropolis]|uniref:Glycosyltransferase n=1 Tax=Rhodococcus erythropolis TaxID=1833 RepID=A0A8I0ZRE1_RHOER|nr:glycosyltransferase [Rhodococcus erythropolis]MBH5141773.1 glycosyltransferase [Rhodococcus erythropolis]
MNAAAVHTVAVVVPVYRGENTIASLVSELQPYTTRTTTPDGAAFEVAEIILVHDQGPDRSEHVLLELESSLDEVRVVWLSRNYGQDAATIAGMATSECEWIVTLDEDGQHDPSYIGAFLDSALGDGSDLVYSAPTNPPPHGLLRNLTSKTAKSLIAKVFALPSSKFQSYRLIRGEIGRKLADIASSGVYLDVALSWVVDRMSTVPVRLRAEGRDESGYNYRSLFSLFWKMVLSSGTRGLRIVSMLGLVLASGGFVGAGYIITLTLSGAGEVPGWSSLMVVVLLCSGAILSSLGMIAEYLGVVLHVLIGRPLYLAVTRPHPRHRKEGAR